MRLDYWDKTGFQKLLIYRMKMDLENRRLENVNVLEKWMHPALCGVNTDNFLTHFVQLIIILASIIADHNNVHPFMT